MLGARLDQHAADAAQAELDRERHADRPAADDDNSGFLHATILVAAGRQFGQMRKSAPIETDLKNGVEP